MRKVCFISSLLLLFCYYAEAQLCTGSLGDPVVFIDFGKGTPIPLANGATTYTYQNGACPNDGFYTLGSQSSGCFSNSWHPISEDHTPGDVNGNMMIVNASVTPDDFFLYPVTGLCGGTTYEFSAWVASLLTPSACNSSGNDPNITFNIETNAGQILGTYNTGAISETSSLQWKQYGLFFTTPVGVTSLQVRMTNKAPGGCGNDLALDDISFRPCGPIINAAIIGLNTLVSDVCVGNTQPYTLSGTNGGFADPAWQWQESLDTGKTWKDISSQDQSSVTIHPTAVGKYMYRVSAAEKQNIATISCRVASNNVAINIHPLPTPVISASSPVCDGMNWQLEVNGGNSWEWSGPNTFQSTQKTNRFTGNFSQSGTYTVKAISDKGCETIVAENIVVNPSPIAFAGADQTICAGKTVTIQATGGGSYTWRSSGEETLLPQPNLQVSPEDSTQYYLTVTYNTGCSRKDTVAIHVNRLPMANAGPDLTILEGDSIKSRGSIEGTAVAIQWEPRSFALPSHSAQPLLFPTENTSFRLQVNSMVGCGNASDEMRVTVLKKPVVPNAFSPNGDGINDTWIIEHLENYNGASIEVFNRYGQAVFESKQYSTPWNGKKNGNPLPAGTYYYVIRLRAGAPTLNGWLLLVR